MLTTPTLDKLKSLRLAAFATAWEAQQADPAVTTLSFDERLALLVDAECLARENKRLATALREAKLRLSQACVEDIDYTPRRELDRALLRQLATGRWIAEHQSVLITGATGTGKTYLASPIAHESPEDIARLSGASSMGTTGRSCRVVADCANRLAARASTLHLTIVAKSKLKEAH